MPKRVREIEESVTDKNAKSSYADESSDDDWFEPEDYNDPSSDAAKDVQVISIVERECNIFLCKRDGSSLHNWEKTKLDNIVKKCIQEKTLAPTDAESINYVITKIMQIFGDKFVASEDVSCNMFIAQILRSPQRIIHVFNHKTNCHYWHPTNLRWFSCRFTACGTAGIELDCFKTENIKLPDVIQNWDELMNAIKNAITGTAP